MNYIHGNFEQQRQKNLYIAVWLLLFVLGSPFYILPLFLLGYINDIFLKSGLFLWQFTMDPLDSFISLWLGCKVNVSFCWSSSIAGFLAPPLYAALYLVFSWLITEFVYRKTNRVDYRFLAFSAVLVAISAIIIFTDIQLPA